MYRIFQNKLSDMFEAKKYTPIYFMINIAALFAEHNNKNWCLQINKSLPCKSLKMLLYSRSNNNTKKFFDKLVLLYFYPIRPSQNCSELYNAFLRFEYTCIFTDYMRFSLVWFTMWRHFQQYFISIVTVSFIGGGNRRKLPTCRKSLTILSHNVVSSTPRLERGSLFDGGWPLEYKYSATSTCTTHSKGESAGRMGLKWVSRVWRILHTLKVGDNWQHL